MKRILGIVAITALLSGCSSSSSTDNGNLDDILKFSYENYKTNTKQTDVLSESDYLSEGVATTFSGDFNLDGVDDILVYSQFTGKPFDVVSIVTEKNGNFEFIPNEIEYMEAYNQKFTMEDGLLIRYLDMGGDEVFADIAQVYLPTSEMLYSTNRNFDITLQANYSDTVVIGKSSKIGPWNDFENYTEFIDEEKNIVVQNYSIHYTLDKEKHMYTERLNEAYIKTSVDYIYPREKVSEEDFENTEFHKNLPMASYSEYIESNENRLLKGLEMEIIGSREIDYSSQLLVVIPMVDTINEKFANKKIVSFEGDSTSELKFTVFGQLESVVINQYESKESTPSTIEMGNIQNIEVTVLANLPNDDSYVEVVGQHHEGEGTYSEVRVVMDKSTNLDNYEAITY